MQPRKVYSSYINTISFDSETGSMIVTYIDPKHKASVYSGITEDVFMTVAQSPSIGQAIHQFVRGKYPHGYAN